MKTAVSVLIGVLTILYPFAVFFGIRHFEPWKIAGLLIVLLALKLIMGFKGKHWGTPLLIVSMVYCAYAVWSNDLLTLRFYPVLVNTGMLVLFAWSLVSPPPIIERLARIQHPNLPPEGTVYTRRVTQVWCAFFIINGSIALVTALWSSFEIWSLYNGLIAYLLMGILFAVEYIVRMKTQNHVR
jgi:uncharacterized membrane protein